MITPELVAFIRAQIALGRPRDQIKFELMQGGGWKEVDVEEVFTSIGLPATTQAPTPSVAPAPASTPAAAPATAVTQFPNPAPFTASQQPYVAPAQTVTPAQSFTPNPYFTQNPSTAQAYSSAAPKRSMGFVLWLALLLVLLGGVFVFAQRYEIQSFDDVKRVLGIGSTQVQETPTCAPGLMYDESRAVCVIEPATQTGDPMTMPLGDTSGIPLPPDSAFQEVTQPAPAVTVTSITPEFNSFRIRVGGLYKNGAYVPAEVHFTALYSDGSKAKISDITAATYQVADTSIATIEEVAVTRNGTQERVVDLKGLKKGKTTLTISFGGLTKVLPIEVLAASSTTTTTAAPRTTTTTTQAPQSTAPAYPACPSFHYYEPSTDTCYPY